MNLHSYLWFCLWKINEEINESEKRNWKEENEIDCGCAEEKNERRKDCENDGTTEKEGSEGGKGEEGGGGRGREGTD